MFFVSQVDGGWRCVCVCGVVRFWRGCDEDKMFV